MPVREPIVAGRFYPAAQATLRTEIRTWFAPDAAFPNNRPDNEKTDAPHHDNSATLVGFMLPHAGYVYCGRVIGATLASSWNGTMAGACLPQRLVMLCPNHTGQGRPMGVWPDGAWRTPLGDMPVDADMAAALSASGLFTADLASHLGEHSIEVLLPFLQSLPAPNGKPDAQRIITPVCVGTRQIHSLREAGLALAEAVRRCGEQGENVGIIVSSDMNHYENQERTMHKDARVLSQALACDPEGLLGVAERENITMCGVAPMALALFAAHALGEPWAELCLYDTSATASGDTSHVVGYAGLRFGLV